MTQSYDRGAILAFLGVEPGGAIRLPTEAQCAEANRFWAERPMTADRIISDCGLANSHASLGGLALGLGNADAAARHAGHAFAHLEALVIDGCSAVEGAEAVPVLAHGLAETCRAHGILDAAVLHAKRHLVRWGKL